MTALPPQPRLGDLLSERPATKMGQVQAAWPYIQAALQAGHSLKVIWERLRADGLDIDYKVLSQYLSRLRRRGIGITAGSESAAPQAGKVALAPALQISNVKDDPAANLRDRLDRPTGFAYRGTGKKEDLV